MSKIYEGIKENNLWRKRTYQEFMVDYRASKITTVSVARIPILMWFGHNLRPSNHRTTRIMLEGRADSNKKRTDCQEKGVMIQSKKIWISWLYKTIKHCKRVNEKDRNPGSSEPVALIYLCPLHLTQPKPSSTVIIVLRMFMKPYSYYTECFLITC